MKAKSLLKRDISFLLVLVLLFSCWVFTATQSNSATAGNYSVSIDAIADNDGDCGNAYIKVWYKDSNGYGTDHQGVQKWSRNDNFNWDGTGSDDQTFSLTGFPYKVEYKVYKRTGAYALGKIKGHFNISVEGVSLGSSNTIEGNSGDMYMTWNWNESSQKPKANYISSFGLASGQSATLTNPVGTNKVTKTISMGTVKDQYGVNWYQDPSAYVVSGAGYSVSGSTVTIGSGALATASNWKTTGTIGVKAGSTVLKTQKNGSTNATVSFTGTNPTYTVTWKYHTNGDNDDTWSGSTTSEDIYYNQKPTAPSSTSKYYNESKHYSGGTYSPTAITEATTFYMSYSTSAGHSYTYSQIANNKINHTATCSCGYSKSVAHQYGDKYTDLGNGQHKRTCGTAGCGFVETEAHTWGAWQIIPDGESANYGNHDRMAKHYRVCTADGCGAIDYDNHTWVAQEKVAPTCTADGHTPYKCSQCQLTTVDLNKDGDGIEDFQPMQGHAWNYDPTGTPTDTQHQEKCSRCNATRMVDHPSYGSWYTKGAEKHAHRCTVCDKEVAVNHPETSWSGWQFNVPPEGVTGVRATVRETLLAANFNNETSCYQYCTDCGEVKTQPHHDWTVVEDSAVTFPATCTEPGKETKACPDCGQTTFTTINPLGHKFKLESFNLDDKGGTGYVAMHCSRCDQYSQAYYDPTNNKYVAEDPETGTVTVTEKPESSTSAAVPAPYVNAESRELEAGTIDYTARGASLKLEGNPSFVEVENDTADHRQTLTQNKQVLRFITSINLPAGFSNSDINPAAETDDSIDTAILDFGFIYTQREGYEKKKGTVSNDYAWKNILTNENADDSANTRVYRMSVAEQNTGKTFDNWTGCTLRDSLKGNNKFLTFNILINVNAKNWSCDYLARSYITYKYRGIVYTVYDEGSTDSSGLCYSYNNVAWVGLQGMCDLTGSESEYSIDYLRNKIWLSRGIWDSKGVMEAYRTYLQERDPYYPIIINDDGTVIKPD